MIFFLNACSVQEQCKEEFTQLAKEREQQAALALEDADLQKTALKTEADNKVKEIQLELETARTVSLFVFMLYLNFFMMRKSTAVLLQNLTSACCILEVVLSILTC